MFSKNAEFIWWLFIIVYCFCKLAHDFQKCGIYLMIIHDCILFFGIYLLISKNADFIWWLFIIVYCFLEISSCFPKMRNLSYDYSLLYIVFWNLSLNFQKCGIYLMIIYYCILFFGIYLLISKNVEFIWWLFIIVYCFLEISSYFPKMRNLSDDYSLLYIVFLEFIFIRNMSIFMIKIIIWTIA